MESWRKHVRVQFSLRAMLLASFLCALVFGLEGIWYRQAKRDRAIIDSLREFGANAYFKGGRVRGLEFLPSGRKAGDEDIAKVRHLQALRTLDLTDTNVTPAGLAHLADLPNLEILWIDASHFSEKDVSILLRTSPRPSISFVETDPGSGGRIIKTIPGHVR